MNIVDIAAKCATLLINSPYSSSEVWDHLAIEVQRQVIDKQLRVYVIDANRL